MDLSDGISQRVPKSFPYEVSLSDVRSVSSLRDENQSFLEKITELDTHVEFKADLDMRFLPSLQRLGLSCSDSRYWRSLECHPLEHLSLLCRGHDLTQLNRAISAKHVRLDIQAMQHSQKLAVARLFPDTQHLTIVNDSDMSLILNIDRLSQLSHLEVNGRRSNVTATQTIHLSSLVLLDTEHVSENITAKRVECDRVSLAVQMLPHVRTVNFRSSCQIDSDESMLKIPRTVVIDIDNECSMDRIEHAASIHMLLNRCVTPASLQRMQHRTFSRLCHRYDEGLLLRVLRESRDVSEFEWSLCTISPDKQCQAFRLMLESQRSIDWSRIVNNSISLHALQFLLSLRPDLAKCAFGERQDTLLHAVCRSTVPKESNEKCDDTFDDEGIDGDEDAFSFYYGDADEEENDDVDCEDSEDDSDDRAEFDDVQLTGPARTLYQCVLSYGADPTVRNAEGKIALGDRVQPKRRKSGRRC